MRRAFTLIELMIVIAIIAILSAIIIPNIMEAKKRKQSAFKPGAQVIVVNSKLPATIIRYSNSTDSPIADPQRYWVRVDLGEGKVPRFQELEFFENELKDNAWVEQ